MPNRLRFLVSDRPLDVRIAAARQELVAAYELVYRSYLAKGYIRPHPGGVVYHGEFGLPVSRTLVAITPDDAVLGTLTVVGDNRLGLQMERTHPSEVRRLRSQERAVAEITCLAIAPACDCRRAEVFFALTQFMIQYAYRREYDDLLLAIHPRHLAFYRRFYQVDALGPHRPHASVGGSPSVPCRIDLGQLKERADAGLWQQYFGRAFPADCFERPPISPADHLYLCLRRFSGNAGSAGGDVYYPDAA